MSVPMRWQEPEKTQSSDHSAVPVRRNQTMVRKSKTRILLLTLLALAAICVAAGGGVVASARWSPNTLRLERQDRSGARVTLQSAVVERNLGFVTVTGSVDSRSAGSLSHVVAVVELLDDQNRTVGMESGLIVSDSLRAGDSSPFRVEMQDYPLATRYRVRFRELLGPMLN